LLPKPQNPVGLSNLNKSMEENKFKRSRQPSQDIHSHKIVKEADKENAEPF